MRVVGWRVRGAVGGRLDRDVPICVSNSVFLIATLSGRDMVVNWCFSPEVAMVVVILWVLRARGWWC
jgi:hypothetical protein